MEDASFICCTEGSGISVSFELTATSVAVNVIERGMEVEIRAKIEACKRAGRTGRFWIFLLDRASTLHMLRAYRSSLGQIASDRAIFWAGNDL